MTNPAWLWRRLRVMGGAEIAFRVGRSVAQGIEAWRIRRGWQPVPGHPPGDGTSLLVNRDGWQVAWHDQFAVDHEGLAELLAGRIDLFGQGPWVVGVPTDWHRDPGTGVVAPRTYGKWIDYRNPAVVGDAKRVWELGRHQHLVPVARAYAVTGEAAYREWVVGQVEGWVADNPFGRGIHWCSALEVALRLTSWVWVHNLLALRDAGGLLAVVSRTVRDAIYRHAWFVAHFLSRHSSANNHLLGELTGLYAGCVAFDLGEDGQRWRASAHQGLAEEAERQVCADGVSREQAIYYHLWVAEYLLFAGLVAERAREPFGAAWWERLAAMGGFLDALLADGGDPPQLGDADDGTVVRFRERWPDRPYHDLLAALGACLDRPAWLARAGGVGEKAYWYRELAGGGAVAHPMSPPATSPEVFPEGGYAVLTGTAAGGLPAKVVFDAGTLGYLALAAHGHADALSFCLALGEQWWLVDPGTYCYHSEPVWRDYFRGTAAHNTVVVDGKDQSLAGGPFLWLRHASARLVDWGAPPGGGQWAIGEHHGYVRGHSPVVHRRRVDLDGDELRIEDVLTGQGRHHVALHLHLAPEVMADPAAATGGFALTLPSSPVRLVVTGDPSLRWTARRAEEDPPLGWYSPHLGKRVPATTLRGAAEVGLPVTLNTRVRMEEG